MPYKDPEKKRENDRKWIREQRLDPKFREPEKIQDRKRKRVRRQDLEGKKAARESCRVSKLVSQGLNKKAVRQYLAERVSIVICDICQQECPSGRSLALDHNHETKKIRGLLCCNCNRGLGLFKDSPTLLQKASEYLNDN